MTILRPRETPLPGAIGTGIGFAGAIAATLVAIALGATHQPGWALLPLAMVVAGVSVFTTWSAGLATAVICWAFDSGFVLGREAHLVFGPQSGLAALALIAVAAASSGLGHAQRGLKGPDRA